jgi:hypothetical protein
MKIFNVFMKLAHDCGLDNEQERVDLTAKIKNWETNAATDDASKLQKLYHKAHKEPIIEVLSPFIYILLRQWFNGILNGESSSSDEEKRLYD